MKELSLEEVLAIPALKAGEIELYSMESVMRGPLKSVVRHEREISFLLEWCAMQDRDDEWVCVPMPQLDISATTRFVQMDYGIIVMSGPGIVAGAIYPKGTSRLDPKIVHGLSELHY